MDMKTKVPICGVRGGFTLDYVCPEPATEKLELVCTRGHTKTRYVCQEHAAIMFGDIGSKECGTCYDEGFEGILIAPVSN